jgi:nicotinamidase-related amidase
MVLARQRGGMKTPVVTARPENTEEGAAAALIVIDVINDLEFEGGVQLLEHALPMADRLAALAARARAVGIPVIYANDNFGRWRSDFRALLHRCLTSPVRGRPVVERLQPGPDDYFVLKPKHSGFYATVLPTLLEHLQVSTLILTGLATNMCVLMTAADAHMRDYTLSVPEDCVAAEHPRDHAWALHHMATVFDADVRPSTALDLAALTKARPPGGARGRAPAPAPVAPPLK